MDSLAGGCYRSSMPDTTPRQPTDLWVAALLLGGQALLYIVYPGLVHTWEFYLFSGSACALMGLVMWETRHLIARRTTHVVHLLILFDTLAEGVLHAHAVWDKETRHDLYCVSAFAIVIVLDRLWAGRKGGDEVQ